MRVGFCVCVITFIMGRDLFSQKFSVVVGVLFFFSFFGLFSDLFKEEKPLRTKPLKD